MSENLQTKIKLSRLSTLVILGTLTTLLSLVTVLLGSMNAHAATAPILSGIAPTSSSRIGGDIVTVTGSGFDANSVVKFNGTLAATTYINSTTLSAVTPTMNGGLKNISVKSVDTQSNTLFGAYTLAELPLSIASVSPSNGPSSGGQVVTIAGQNLIVAIKDVTRISAGNSHSCGIYNGKAYCWGSNVNGQLGDGSRNNSMTPVAVSASGALAGKTVTDVSVGTSHACAIADGQAYCWGTGTSGRLGNNSIVPSYTPSAVTVSGVLAGKTVTAISAGSNHTCAVASGQAYCWGFADQYGQLGNNTAVASLVPVAVNVAGVLAGKTVTGISVGNENTCVVANGQAHCWGNGIDGRLGNATAVTSRVPVAVDVSGVLAGKTVSAISVNSLNTCAVASGQAFCWGNGLYGKLGNAALVNKAVPVAVDTTGVLSGKTIQAIATGGNHSCVVASDNQAYCWGYNAQGQLGNNSITLSTVPVAVNTAGALAGKTIDSISGGNLHTCAVYSNNRAYCWGYNLLGQLGDGSITQSNVAASVALIYTTPPAVLFGGATGSKVNVSSSTAMTVITPQTTPGSVAIEVASYDGQTATLASSYTSDFGPSISNVTPNQGLISGGDTVTLTGSHFTAGSQVFIGGIAMKNVITVNDTTVTATLPAGVAGERDVEVVASDGQRVILSNAFTYNNLAPSIQAVNPLSGSVLGGQQVTITGQNFTPGTREVSQITLGVRHACGIYNQQAYCWGSNIKGQLGNNTRNDSLVPVAVDMTSAGLEGLTIKAISAGDNFTCAIASNNAVYCWGQNSYGALGMGSALNSIQYVPIAVSTAGVLAGKSVEKVSTGRNHACVIDSAGVAYCWGQGYDGQLGNGSSYSSSLIPVAVSTTGALLGKTVLIISAGADYTCAIASDSKAYCWGNGSNGKLGNNSSVSTSTPVPVDNLGILFGKNMTNIVAGYGHTCAISSEASAYCWGASSYGAIGDGQTTIRFSPVQVSSMNLPVGVGLKAISVAYNSTCALGTDNQVYCWGQNTYGQLGNGSGAQSLVPIPLTTKGSLGVLSVLAVETNESYVCATTSDHQSHCWGNNTSGQLGNNTTTNSTSPTAMRRSAVQQPNVLIGAATATNVKVLSDTSISLVTPAGTAGSKNVTVTQYDAQNTSQAGAYTYMLKPELTSLAPQKGSAAGGDTVVVSGNNFTSQTKIKFDNSYITNVSFNSESSLSFTVPARSYAGKVTVSVEDEFGVQSAIVDSFTYVELAPVITSVSPNVGPEQGGQSAVINGQNLSVGKKELSQIATGENHSCGIYDGSAYCWGLNTSGQLGDNSKNNSAIPVAVYTSGALSGKTIASIDMGVSFTCAVTTDSLVFCWGAGVDGMLGNNTNTESIVPIAVYIQGALSGKTISKLSSGSRHTCVIASDNRVYCWGYGYYGTLGNGMVFSGATSNVPVATITTGVLAGKDIRDISSGYYHTCALDTDGKAYCWGENGSSQLGDGTSTNFSVPRAVDTYGVLSGKKLDSIAAGAAHTCAVDSESEIYCWGNGSSGQLANNATAVEVLPVRAPFAGGLVASITAGYNHTCIATTGGKAYCSGYNSKGQIGIGSIISPKVFTPIFNSGALAGKGIYSVEAGGFTTCALAYDEQGYCWGQSTYGQVGNDETTDSLTPSAVQTIKIRDPLIAFAGIPVTQTQSTSSSAINVRTPSYQAGLADVSFTRYDGASAILSDGYEYIKGPEATSITPSSGVTTGGDIVTISGNGFQQDSRVFVGIFEATSVTYVNSTTMTFSVPAGTAGIRNISVRNLDGQNSTLPSSFTYFEPSPIFTSVAPSNGPTEGGQEVMITGQNFSLGAKEASQIVTAVNHSCGIYAGQAYCWGMGLYGRLGTGTNSNVTVPTAVSTTGVLSGKSILSLSTNNENTCAIASDKQAYCWGRASSGALGNNVNYGDSYAHTPIPMAVYTGGVLSGKTIKAISTGALHSCVIASDNQAYCWGSTGSGQLGNGIMSAGDINKPVAVNVQGGLAGKTIKAISAGSYHTCAIASDNQAYCWGAASRLGQGTGAASSTPVAVSQTGALSGKSLVSISAGDDHTCAVSTEGAVYCWGLNANSQVGDGTTATTFSPVLANAMNGISNGTVASVSAGYRHTCAIGTNGAAYCWGLNESGELGDGSVTSSVTAKAVSIIKPSSRIFQSVYSGKFNSCGIASDNQSYCWGSNVNGQHGNATTAASLIPAAVQPLTIANMTVLFGTYQATNVRVQSPTTILATTPAHVRGASNVTIQRYDSKSVLGVNSYDFTIPPGALSLSQIDGPLAGGNTLTVTGNEFLDGLKVKVGTHYASEVTVIDSNTATFVVPAGAAPVATDVIVEDLFGQTSTLTAAYSYKFQSQNIASVSPTVGTMAGGTVVTITGSGFSPKEAGGSWYTVWFGDKAATNVTYVNETTLRATTPATTPGAKDIQVRSDYSSAATLASGFNFMASSYAFTNNPVTVAATQPGKLTITARNASGSSVASTSNTLVTLSSSSNTGAFARSLTEDEASRWEHTTVILPAGQSSVDVWYKDSTSGTPVITGAVEGVARFTHAPTINSLYKFQVSGISDPVKSGVASSVTVRVVDYAGYPVMGYDGTFSFSSTDLAAQLPSSTAMKISDYGVKTLTNGVTMKTQGERCVTVTDVAQPSITGTQCSISVQAPEAGTITKLAIISSEQRLSGTDSSAPITIQTKSADGRAIPVAVDTQIYLYSNASTGKFSADQTQWTQQDPLTVTIPAGSSSVNVYFKDGTSRTTVLSARDLTTDVNDSQSGDFGLTNAKQSIVTGGGPPTSIAMSGPLTLLASENGNYTLELRDSNNQALTSTSDMSVILTSSTATGRFVSAAEPSESNTKTIVIPTGDNSVTFQFKDTAANIGTQFSKITVADSRPESDANRLSGQDLTIQIVAAYPTKSTIKAAKTSLNAGEIVQVTTTLIAVDDTLAYATDDTNLTLTSTSAKGEFSLTESPFVPITSVALAKGQSTRTLFFRNTLAGSVTIRAVAANMTTVSETVSVTSVGVSSFRINTSVTNLPYDTSSNAVSVGAYDLYGNIVLVSSDLPVYLFASEASTHFATAASGVWNATSVVIPTGQSVAQFYIKDGSFHSGSVAITATAQSPLEDPDTTIARAEHAITIVGQAISSIVITTQEQSIVAGGLSDAIQIELKKSDGTPSIQDGKSALSLQANEGHFIASRELSAASISGVTVPAGQSGTSFYYTSKKIGEHSISVAKLGIASVSQKIVVTPASASVMQFAGIAQTTKAGASSSAIRVNFVDAFNNAASFSSDQTFSVTSSCGTGSFSTGSTNWSDVPSFTVAAGATDATFYYKDSAVGNCSMSVTHSLLETITQSITIISSAPSKLIASVSPANPIKGQRAAVAVTTLDEDGNIRPVDTPTTVYVSSTSTTADIETSTIIFAAGESSKSTPYTDTTIGENTISIRDQLSTTDAAGTMADTSLQITYIHGPATAVSLTPSTSTMRAGELQKLTVGLKNEFNIETPATVATTVSLTTDSASVSIKDQLGNIITEVVVPANSLSVDIFLTQSQSGVTRVTAQSATLESRSANVTTLSETVNEMRITNLPYVNAQALEVGEPGSFRVGLYDVYGNIATTEDDITLHAVSDVTSSAIPDAGNFIVKAGNSSESFTYAQTSVGAFTISIDTGSTGGLMPVSQNGQVIPGAAADFIFSAKGIALERGAVSDAVTISLQNAYGAPVLAGVGGKVVSLEMAKGSGTFSADSNGVFTETMNVVVAEGESSADFYYRNDDASIESRRCNGALDETRKCSTETTFEHSIQGRIVYTSGAEAHQIPVDMSYGTPVQLAFTTPARTQEANRPSYVMTVERQNQYGEAVPLYENSRIYLDSNANGTGDFGSSKVMWDVNSVLILDSQASASFYYQDTAEGQRTVTASDSADPLRPSTLVSASQLITLLPTQYPLPEVENFLVTNISDPQSQGNNSSVIVVARDSDGYIINSYQGTVTFTSNDPSASLPESYTFNPSIDKGSKTFTNQVAFQTPGEKTVTATDTNGIVGSQTDITITGGNSQPVVSVAITQPESPLQIPVNTSSNNITVELRDENGDATVAPFGGVELVLSSTLSTTEFKALPSDSWSTNLALTVPAGLSFVNFYIQGTATGSADITAYVKSDPARISNILTVISSDISLISDTNIRSMNAFGQYQDSTYLFSSRSDGSIKGFISSRYDAKDTFAQIPVPLNWKSMLRQGTTILESAAHSDTSGILFENVVNTTAGAQNITTEVEATHVLLPSGAKQLQEEVQVSAWKTSTSVNKQTSGYGFMTAAQNNGQAAQPAFVEVLLLPSNATDSSQALSTQRFNAPQSAINYFVTEDGSIADGMYRTLVTTYNNANQVTSQELTSEFRLDSSPTASTDPSTNVPVGNVLEQPVIEPQTPGEAVNGDVSIGTDETSENTPLIVGGKTNSKGTKNSVSSNDKAIEYASSKSGLSDVALQTAIVSTYVATTSLVILFIREAYKELARVVRLRSMLKRERKLAADKNTFLALSAHYLRTPITILDAASSMVISPDNALQKAVTALRIKANALLEEGVEKSVVEIQNPDIAKATRSALLSVFFWLPIVLSIVVTIAVTMLLNAAAAGQPSNPVVVYAVVVATAVVLIALFGGRTVYINKQRVQMEQTLQLHRAQLFEAKSQFIVGIRTEINEEVARVKQFAAYATVPENVRAMLLESVQRLDSLIGKLAIAAQINSLVDKPTAFSVDRLVDAAVEHYQEAIQAHHVTLARQHDDNGLINQDGRLLRYVTGSVLDNAIQYGKEGSVIDIASKKHKGAIEMTIANDTNLVEGVEGIFEPFNHATTQGDLTVGGAGLSLYLDKLIMNHLGGDITAKGARGDGKVSIRLTFPSIN